MDISLTLSNRELKPAVVNCFQNENETTILKFTLDSYIYGGVDLQKYTPYAVTSINGQVDMTELESTIEDSKLVLTWNVQEYSLRQEGAICYQIVFKEDTTDGENTAVFYSYKAILLNRASINADDHITANYPTILKQWLDRINQLSGTYDAEVIYIPCGETIPESERLAGRLYFQYRDVGNTEGRFEDHTGKELKLESIMMHEGNSVIHITDAERTAWNNKLTQYITNQNLNTLLTDGSYIVAGTITNAPIANTYCLVNVYDSASTNRIIQEVTVPQSDNSVRVFSRAITGTSTFGPWSEYATAESVTVDVSQLNAVTRDHEFELTVLEKQVEEEYSTVTIENFESNPELADIDGSSFYSWNENDRCIETSDLQSEFVTNCTFPSNNSAREWDLVVLVDTNQPNAIDVNIFFPNANSVVYSPMTKEITGGSDGNKYNKYVLTTDELEALGLTSYINPDFGLQFATNAYFSGETSLQINNVAVAYRIVRF